MKKLSFLIIISCLSCSKKEVGDNLPSFESNSSMDEVWNPIRAIISDNDFSIAYTVDSGEIGLRETSLKILTLKNGVWQKIEVRMGIQEVDTVFQNSEVMMPTGKSAVDTTFRGTSVDMIEKEILLKKECRKEETQKFLNELVNYKLFELAEEKELLEKCRQQRKDKVVPTYTDVGSTIFYIIKGRRVRRLVYQEYKREEDCPGMIEWSNIRKIQELFEKEWYAKKHY